MYNCNTNATILPAAIASLIVGVEQADQPMDVGANSNGHAAADFLSLIKVRKPTPSLRTR